MIPRTHIATLLFLLPLQFLSYAQKTPCFTTVDTIGCVPYFVKVNNCSGAALPRYNYGEGIQTLDSLTVDSTHTYTSAGIFDIRQYIGTSQITGTTTPTLIRAVSDIKPLFTINYCKDLIINITFDPENLYDNYIIDYGDGTKNDTVSNSETPSHQYLNEDQKTIKITGTYNYAPCSNFSVLSVSPQKELILPIIESFNTILADSSNGSFELNIKPSPFFRNKIHLSEELNTFSILDTFITNQTDTSIFITNINNKKSSFCTFFTSFDYCSNSIVSDTICSIAITSTPENNLNSVSWSAYPLINQIEDLILFKNTDTLPLTKSAITKTDSNVTCANDYCYQLQTKHMSGTIIKSNKACITSFSTNTPLPITSFKSSIANNSIQLIWKSPSPYIVKTSLIEKSYNNTPYANFTTISNFDTITDDLINENPSCYIINYIDACDNPSDISLADTTCNTILTIEQIHDSKYIIDWSSYKGFQSPTYIIQYLDENQKVALEKQVTSSPFIDESPLQEFQKLQYRIKVIGDNDSSFSNIISFDLKPRLFMPNAFSPDQDGVNDYFKPDARFLKEYSLTIFNRWGQLIYQENNAILGWDGTYNGETVPIESYVYILDGTDFTGEKVFKKGTVTVYY